VNASFSILLRCLTDLYADVPVGCSVQRKHSWEFVQRPLELNSNDGREFLSVCECRPHQRRSVWVCEVWANESSDFKRKLVHVVWFVMAEANWFYKNFLLHNLVCACWSSKHCNQPVRVLCNCMAKISGISLYNYLHLLMKLVGW